MKKVTLFGREFEFFWRDSKTSTSSSPTASVWIFFLLVAVFLLFAVNNGYDSLNNGVSLTVMDHSTHFKTFKQFDLPDNNAFIAGGGTLHWQPKSLKEALILNMADSGNYGDVDIFEVALMLVFVLLFCVMIWGSKRKIIFTSKTTFGTMLIGLAIAISGPLEFKKTRFVNDYVQTITHGQFELRLSHFPSMYFYALGMMLIPFLSSFPRQAVELQQESELTI